MVKFAAYDDASIYAVADSPDSAIQKARDDANDPSAQFSTAAISDRFAAWIEENGWDCYRRSFKLDKQTGFLVDTTNQLAPTLTLTIKADKSLTSHAMINAYISQLIDDHPELTNYRYALVDVVNTQIDDTIELYDEPDMDGEYVSPTKGTLLLWLPIIGRAALNSYQAGDWQWTDADSPEDAIRRYREDDMRP
jgi:hypothetical protein